MSSAFDKLLEITSELEKASIWHELKKCREDSIQILALVPGH